MRDFLIKLAQRFCQHDSSSWEHTGSSPAYEHFRCGCGFDIKVPGG